MGCEVCCGELRSSHGGGGGGEGNYLHLEVSQVPQRLQLAMAELFEGRLFEEASVKGVVVDNKIL